MNKNQLLKFIISLTLATTIISCDKNKSMPAEVEAIPVNVKIERFDQQFVELKNENLQKLKSEYPFLFPEKFIDEFWIKKSKDTLQLKLVKEVKKVFPNTDHLTAELVSFYKYLIYYYPQIEVPRIVTLISEVDYKNSVLLRKELLLLSLDNYLGADHFFYEGMDKYISEDLKLNQLVPNIASEYAKKIVSRTENRDFLSQMILYGKRIYLMQKCLPNTSVEELFGCSKEDLIWFSENESFVWRYFIEKNMLFSTDKQLLPRFIYPGPFSKFYLELDQQSPDQVGRYIGYQIVLAYIKNNDVSLQELMELNGKIVFESSKYKPKK